jgi:hypothetical protein
MTKEIKRPPPKPKPEEREEAAPRRELIGRPGKLSEVHRERIQVGVLLELLHQHAVGKKKLTITRLKAIEILLKKKLPDLGVENGKGDVAPVTFVFGAAPAQGSTHPAAVMPGASPSVVVATGGAGGGDGHAPATNPFVIGPSSPPEADTKH